MAFAISELIDSRVLGIGRSASAELTYQAVDDTPSPDYGTNLERAALDAVVAAAPTTFDGMAKVGARVRPVDGQRTYRVTVQYGVPATGGFTTPLEIDDYRIDFPGGSSTELVTQAYEERRYPDPGAIPLGGAINVTDKGVEGVQLEVPEFVWNETWIRSNATATFANIAAIQLLRKTVNNAAFRGFAAGEVFLDDMTASPRTDDDWEYRYTFRARANRLDLSGSGGADNSLVIGTNGNPLGGANPATPLEPGDGGYDADLDYRITGVEKLGWEYLWIQFRKETGATGTLVEVPDSVYVNQVYRTANFALLGIGTGIL